MLLVVLEHIRILKKNFKKFRLIKKLQFLKRVDKRVSIKYRIFQDVNISLNQLDNIQETIHLLN